MSQIVQRHIPCPNPECGSSDAYCLYDDGHGYCFSCGKAQFINEKQLTEDITFEYLPFRGLTQNTMRFFEAKTRIVNDKPESIQYTYENGSYVLRKLNEKDFRSMGDISSAGLWAKDKFSAGSARAITITEGREDAMAIYQVLGSKYPAVSVQSSTTAKRDCSIDRDFLNSFEKIYLCFDADDPGKRALAEVATLFDFNKVYHVRLTKHKDANDYLRAGDGEELKQIWWNARRFQPEQIKSSLAEMEAMVLTKPQRGIDYPFPTLNRMLYGIREGESVLITAQEGVGKTEIMRTIEYKILTETNHNVAAIYLEEPGDRHLKGLAGIELKSPVHLPDTCASESEIVGALRRVVGKDDRLHLYSHFGTDDPDVILDTIRFCVSACGCRVVMLDHISMVVSGLASEDERKALDYIATRLEMMVKELKFALIFVSHVNDTGQTRGSRYISKVADIRIDATRDVESGSTVINLKVTKNRFSGTTGPAGTLIFDPSTYTLAELSNDLPTVGDAPPLQASQDDTSGSAERRLVH